MEFHDCKQFYNKLSVSQNFSLPSFPETGHTIAWRIAHAGILGGHVATDLEMAMADTGCPSIIDLSGRKRLAIGRESFEDVMASGVFIDKSLLIRAVIDSFYGATLFCRPRRFGKSLAMRMLQCFFEAPVEGRIRNRRHLFEPLAIWNCGDEYRCEQGRYPVIFLSLGTVDGPTWEEAEQQLACLVAAEFNRHYYVLDSTALNEHERARYRTLCSSGAHGADLRDSLSFLSGVLERHHGAQTVILIDEYDQPVTSGYLRGYRDEAVSFMRSWLTGALKATDTLRLACLTGVQRISRESIFSGLNNLMVNTALDGTFSEWFGFTAREAEALADYLGYSHKVYEMRGWYDGYCFGGTAVYNPWSVLNYLAQDGVAQPYWGNTSDNAIIHNLFQRATRTELEKLEGLAAGNTVNEPLNMTTVYSESDENPSAVWSQLYLAGYVTTNDVGFPNDRARIRRLRIPNREVACLFRDEFLDRSVVLAGGVQRLDALWESLIKGEPKQLERELRGVLENSLSHFDLTREDTYHTLLVGLIYSVPGYRFPFSNRENGNGRPDILLVPEHENEQVLPAIVIEVKRSSTRDHANDLARLATMALEQAAKQDYAINLTGKGALLWGIAFGGKDVACACRTTC